LWRHAELLTNKNHSIFKKHLLNMSINKFFKLVNFLKKKTKIWSRKIILSVWYHSPDKKVIFAINQYGSPSKKVHLKKSVLFTNKKTTRIFAINQYRSSSKKKCIFKNSVLLT
jgi:hypothetical protein